ncbi:MAG: type II toxin-antitoxin system VapC family toxin [Nitrososphaerota archaeon]|nr:type II toxin-antitoxin system VapC family toxin [Nitrososphaerota archaeon]
MISIDSYGWIERFTSGPKSSRYNRIIDRCNADEIITSVVVLYEVYKRVKRMKGEEMALEAVAALSQTRVISLDQTLVLEAADYSLEEGLHFADALVYATARHYGTELHTSDEHLKGLKDVVFV